MFRILILSTWFPPVNAPGARRPYQLARCLVRRGWDVAVLTSDPEGPLEPYGDLTGIRLIRMPRTAPTRDLNLLQRVVLRSFQATQGSWWNGPMRVLADLTLPLLHSQRWDVDPARIEAEIGPRDIVLATTPEIPVLEKGYQLARHFNAAWAVDYRDPWNVAVPEVAKDIITHQGRGIAGLLRRARMRRMERRLCGPADLLTAVSQAFLANAQAITGLRHGVVVRGGFDATRRPLPRSAGERLVITHTGQLYPEQPWNAFFRVLRELERQQPTLSSRLRMRFVGANSTQPALMDELRSLAGSLSSVELIPAVDPGEALRLQEDSDLLLQPALVGRRGYLPVKFLEYLGAGRPILLLSDEADEMEEVIRTTRAGSIVRTAQLEGFLVDRLKENAEGRRSAYDPAHEALADFDYQHNMERWAELLAGLLERRTRAGSHRPA